MAALVNGFPTSAILKEVVDNVSVTTFLLKYACIERSEQENEKTRCRALLFYQLANDDVIEFHGKLIVCFMYVHASCKKKM